MKYTLYSVLVFVVFAGIPEQIIRREVGLCSDAS